MLDNLVESKNNGMETAKRAKFLGTTFVLVLSLAFSGVLWSMFAKNIAMSGDQFEISTMITPVPIPEDKPQPPEPAPKQLRTEVKNAVTETTRQTNMLRVDESPKVPDTISVVKNTQMARPLGSFKLTKGAEVTASNPSAMLNERGANAGNGISQQTNQNESTVSENKLPEPPPPPKIKKPEPPQKPPTVKSGGVMNGKAEFLPKPTYSAAAKAINASGEVNVQITVDESGKVISASAISGHPLLRQDAERAARGARFSPTLLSNQPVKVTGIIVYRFTK